MANNDNVQLPVYSVDLIEQLDKNIPEMTPEKTWSDREIWMYAGKRELIRVLKIHKKRTEDEAYKE